MKIAIASGKGGTGKTTIATNLAHTIAQMDKQVQYLDCDVEEPNGHIFLKPEIKETKTVTVDVPEVDLEKCIGCGKCGQLCQYSAIVHLKDNNVLTFEQLCHSCGGCLHVCPADAIKLKQLNIGEIELGKTGDIDFVHGKLRIGYVRTVSLIRQVKQHIAQDSLAIIDVPPGTSCPVVEAVKDVDFVLLVTEPTPFGLNDLKLAVGLVREMNLPFEVIINRHGIGDDQVEKYCKTENIKIALKFPDDRRVAESYSTGQMIVDVLPEYKKLFDDFAQKVL
ncbi:MAG: ATP-binding protein [Planctomycetes bacterium]|nr:ATP-binding protein [Planctomycetota bacterium]